ncbi:MAG: dihydrodipicolinate synthase family protein, partial [Beijerinckiaceae bacterium]
AEHITNRSDKLTLMVGVDTEVFHGYVYCGASGAITGIGNALPRAVLHLARLCEQAQQGDPKARRQARELEGALKVLSTFDEGADLVLFYKYLMVLEGNPEYELHFNPTDALSDSQRIFARDQLALFKRWYAAWTAENA